MTTRRRAAHPPEGSMQLIATCRHCGEYYNPLEGEIEGVCPTCAAERYTTCPECGEVVENTNLVTLEGGRRICQSCADRLAILCTECGRWHMADEVQHITDRHGNRVCEHCWESYSRCERCGGWFRSDETSERDGAELCVRCADEIDRTGVQSYYFQPQPIFHRADGEPENSLVLGVELEMDYGDGDIAASRISKEYGTDWLYFKHDGSLDEGVELVTHPISPAVLASNEGRAMWERISEIALEEGCRSHDTRTCGLHVHVNRDYFGKGTARQEMAELKLTGIVDRFFEPLTIFSRRKPEQLTQWAKRPMLPKTKDGWQQRAKTCRSVSCHDRYRAINVTNDHTIEFRLFRGTLKPSTLQATFQFVSGLCAVAKDATVGELDRMSWYELCDAIIEKCPVDATDLENYLIERELMCAKEELLCA